MKVLCLMSGSFGSNCYVIVDDIVAVVDPGLMIDAVLKRTRELHIVDLLFINTHCHYDHLGCIPELMKALKGDYLIHEKDAASVEDGLDEFLLAGLFDQPAFKLKVSRKLKEGDVINLGKTSLEVVHTPGHTPGSICLYEPVGKSLFTGDTIFADGVGRTDLPGGSTIELKKSIEKLIQLKENRGVKKVYPGHGPVGDGGCIERVYEMFF
ncbi:MAG: MBL fold metallo-hydrolase [Candidatus Altiarchaeota archaeon]